MSIISYLDRELLLRRHQRVTNSMEVNQVGGILVHGTEEFVRKVSGSLNYIQENQFYDRLVKSNLQFVTQTNTKFQEFAWKLGGLYIFEGPESYVKNLEDREFSSVLIRGACMVRIDRLSGEKSVLKNRKIQNIAGRFQYKYSSELGCHLRWQSLLKTMYFDESPKN